MKYSSFIVAAIAGIAQAAPRPGVSDFSASHPGYSKTDVYTPPNPGATLHVPANGTLSVRPTGTGHSWTSPTASGTASKDACASVSAASASYVAASPSATAKVPAKLAYDCLNSVPFNQTAAEALMQALEPYSYWQSTLEYVKQPPAEYAEKVQAPYDFYGEFDTIKSKVSAGAYKSEYEFGFEVYRAYQRTHDGHFVYYPDSVTYLVNFGRTTPLVSISEDGTSVPKIYVYSDILAASYSKTTASRISPVAQIDGQDAVEYLLNWSEYGSLQDPDALWNNLFYSPAQVALGSSGSGVGIFAGAGRGRYIYPGDSTTLTFANGTSKTSENFASILQPFDGISNGEDLYTQYFAQPEDSYYNIFNFNPFDPSMSAAPSSTASSTASATAEAPASTAATSTPNPGYPSPVVINPSNENSGYFLDGKGYNDIAVLAVNSFAGSPSETQFQDVNSELIAAAVKSNKTKLIIDVSANGGGTILQGYDLFKQLFPSILPYQAQRFRAWEAANLLGQQASYISSQYPRSLNESDDVVGIESDTFSYQTDATTDYQPFTSWEEKFGPHKYGPAGDEFTSLFRWNLSDVLIITDGGIDISGYAGRENVTQQPFKAEDIIIIYDGYCASTCTIFSELMRTQGGVKTISLGGRPNLNITQAVGGVKGTNDLGYDYITGFAQEVVGLSNDSLVEKWKKSVVANFTMLPIARGLTYNFNFRDGIKKDDVSQTPTQFVYEKADCRILYTPEMVIDETAVWKTVADTVWGGRSACVAGSNNFYGNGTAGRYKRSGELVSRHAVREDFNYQEAMESLELRTGKGKSGDGYMPI